MSHHVLYWFFSPSCYQFIITFDICYQFTITFNNVTFLDFFMISSKRFFGWSFLNIIFTNISIRTSSNTSLIESQLKQTPLSMDARAVAWWLSGILSYACQRLEVVLTRSLPKFIICYHSKWTDKT